MHSRTSTDVNPRFKMSAKIPPLFPATVLPLPLHTRCSLNEGRQDEVPWRRAIFNSDYVSLAMCLEEQAQFILTVCDFPGSKRV